MSFKTLQDEAIDNALLLEAIHAVTYLQFHNLLLSLSCNQATCILCLRVGATKISNKQDNIQANS